MNLFKKRSRANPVALWFVGDGESILPEGYTTLENNEEVQKAAHKIADLVSNMTIMLMQNSENGDIRIKDGLSRRLDIEPAANITRKSFIYSLVKDMIFGGNAIVFPETDSASQHYIKSLKLLSRKYVSLVPDGDSYYASYLGKKLMPDEILNFPLNPSAQYPWRGRGFTPMLQSAVMNLAQANATKRGFLKSKWKPSLIISCDSDSDDLLNRNKRKKILDSYTATVNAGDPWLIPAGEIDVKTINPLTLNDLAVNDSIAIDTKLVAAATGVPSFLLGVGEFNKDEYNNFISTTIMSFATIIQQELTRQILVADDRYFRMNERSLYQYNINEKINLVKQMTGGGMLNKNEGRCEMGYSPVDVEGMNDYTVLENYLKVEDLSKQKKLDKGGDDD